METLVARCVRCKDALASMVPGKSYGLCVWCTEGLFGFLAQEASQNCPMCGGTGKNGNLVCNYCGGRGIIG
jgi:DnaJ-class molecular chaperone